MTERHDRRARTGAKIHDPYVPPEEWRIINGKEVRVLRGKPTRWSEDPERMKRIEAKLRKPDHPPPTVAEVARLLSASEAEIHELIEAFDGDGMIPLFLATRHSELHGKTPAEHRQAGGSFDDLLMVARNYGWAFS